MVGKDSREKNTLAWLLGCLGCGFLTLLMLSFVAAVSIIPLLDFIESNRGLAQQHQNLESDGKPQPVGAALPEAFTQRSLESIAEVAARAASEKAVFREQIGGWVDSEDFDALEHLKAAILSGEKRFKTDDSELAAFYEGVVEAGTRVNRMHPQLFEEMLAHWRAEKPASVTPMIILARHYVKLAWEHRSSKWGHELTQAQRSGFREYIDKAWTVLDEAQALSIEDPHYYAIRLQAAQGRAMHNGQRYKLFERGFQLDQTHTPLLRALAYPLLPRWYGDPGDLEGFADWVATQTQDKWGDYAYVVVVDVAGQHHRNNPQGFYGKFDFDWSRIKQGFLDRHARYPLTPRDINLFLWHAIAAKDYQTAAILARQLGPDGEHYDDEVWNSREWFDEWRQWLERRVRHR